MKRIFAGGVSGLFAVTLALGMTACNAGNTFGDPDVTYRIDATVSEKAEDQISELLFGVFLEDINYAAYALDDNLVCNGSFEYAPSTTYGWTASGVQLSTEQTESLIGSNPTYAVVTPQAGGTLKNGGYAAVPIAVKEGVDYIFTAFIKASDYSGNVKVSVKDHSQTYAESAFEVTQSDEWVKYKATLEAKETKDSGLCFAIEFGAEGMLLLDGVMLETTDETCGIKQYLYDAIAGLSPKFVRFPGGCVIEGRTMSDAYDWKNSIGVDSEDKVPEFTYTLVENGKSSTVTTRGEAATRTPNVDIWQGGNYYLMEYCTGFYEYFLLCDHLGASAIPIVNCGLSCMIQTGGGRYNVLEGRYGNGIQDYIDEAIDLVAFAMGDPDSTDANEAYWAKVRADMGHEAPFKMQYLGVGNEQWGEDYFNYYQQFLEAFKAKAKENPLYGKVELIVGNGPVFGQCENPENGTRGLAQSAAQRYKSDGKIGKLSEYGVHDHHYYMNFVDFLANTTLYDGYSRDESRRYDVFVGEYSANQAKSLKGGTYDFSENTWITALSEAAYMTGLERNGDVVKLAAYAPMFGNVTPSFNQWPADMMFYTNTALVRTPNYYVQQLFAKNQGSTVLATETVYSSAFEPYTEIESKGKESTEIEKLYRIVSHDKATGDIVIKLVNAGEETVSVNFEISSASLTGDADVTVLQCDDTMAKNTLKQEEVSPETSQRKVAKKFGYAAEGYSVTVIRVHVK